MKTSEGVCPGFSWDGVNFILSSWSSAVFWIWCENNVDNILMVLVVAGNVYTKSRTFWFLGPCQQEGWRGTGN